MKSLHTICCALLTINAQCQSYLLANEELVYSFETYTGKTLMIAKDSNDNYLTYRYGTAANIELEYPAYKKKSSWKQFNYSYYYRGGGVENAGLDLNYLYFDIDPFRYVVYWTYSAESDEVECGILVIDQNTGERTDIKGKVDAIKGSLINGFRDNDLVPEGDFL
jgi:hypothetical protein